MEYTCLAEKLWNDLVIYIQGLIRKKPLDMAFMKKFSYNQNGK